MMTTANIKLPPLAFEVLGPPLGAYLFRGLHGGRGSGKSRSAAKAALVHGIERAGRGLKTRVLCTRKFQASIKESFLAELKAAIQQHPWMETFYDVGVDYLRSHCRRVEFIFKGLERNIGSIKSLAEIHLTIVEEAEDVGEIALEALEPTVLRAENSEVWYLWNPRDKGSPVDKRLRGDDPAPRSIVREINWRDNPFFPAGMEVLRQRHKETWPDAVYQHVWEGEYLVNTESRIFHNWEVRAFEVGADWHGPYQGGDFGFSTDPTAVVQAWIHGDDLYISHESGGHGIELDHIPKKTCVDIPGFELNDSLWDSASPGSISLIKRAGLPRAKGAKKYAGSVEDGIRQIQTFRRVYIHERCARVADEFRLYSYKVDSKSGAVLNTVVDDNNHWIDALRYALSPMLAAKKSGFVLL